jgi:predicted dehydrogenase
MLSTHRLKFMEGEDSAQVLVRFDNGVVGTLTTSWAYMPSANTERFSVVGEKGSLFSDGQNLSYRLRTGEQATLEFPSVNEFAAEIAHFAQSVLSGTKPIHSEKEGIEVLGIILAAYESARTKSIAPVMRADADELATVSFGRGTAATRLGGTAGVRGARSR